VIFGFGQCGKNLGSWDVNKYHHHLLQESAFAHYLTSGNHPLERDVPIIPIISSLRLKADYGSVAQDHVVLYMPSCLAIHNIQSMNRHIHYEC